MIPGTAPTASNSRPQVCTVWPGISYAYDPQAIETPANTQDTKETADQARANNAARAAYCGKPK